MQTRVYRGREIGGLMNQIRKEHGDDAVIVSTREVDRNIVEVQVQVSKMLGTQSVKSSDTETGYISSIPIDTRLPFKHKFVALIGSTGVGKTTTIAKLAARMHMAFDIRIGLISADYYRVGAGYQLQTYADLMKLPYKSVGNAKNLNVELDLCMQAFKDFDLVFIDAAGFSPNESEKLDELSEIFNCSFPIERLLVLPAPGNEPDLQRSIKRFSHVGFDRVIISKLDESGYITPVLNAVKTCGKPLAFLTNGQRVPEDIEPASHKKIAGLLARTLH